jgi:hypothetical protein
VDVKCHEDEVELILVSLEGGVEMELISRCQAELPTLEAPRNVSSPHKNIETKPTQTASARCMNRSVLTFTPPSSTQSTEHIRSPHAQHELRSSFKKENSLCADDWTAESVFKRPQRPIKSSRTTITSSGPRQSETLYQS